MFAHALANNVDNLNLLQMSLSQTRASSHSEHLALSTPYDNACIDNACDDGKEPSHSSRSGRKKEWFSVNGTKFMYKAYDRGILPCKDASGLTIPKCYTIGCGGDGDFHMRYNWGCLGANHIQNNWPAEQKQTCAVRHNEDPQDWQPWGLATFARSFDEKVVVQVYQCSHYCSPSSAWYVDADGTNLCPMQSSMTMVAVKAGVTAITWGTSRDTEPTFCTSANRGSCSRSLHSTKTWVRVGDEIIRPANSGWASVSKKVQDPELGEILIVIRGWDIKVSGGAGSKNFFLVESVMGHGYVTSLVTHMQAPLLDMDPNGKSICTNVWSNGDSQNPGQSTGSPVVVAPGSAEFTLVFTQAELDSRCSECVWGRLAQMRLKNGLMMVAPKWRAHEKDPFPPTLEECLQFEMYPGACDSFYNPRSCENPWAPGEPVPQPEEKCKETNCSYSFAERLCAPLKDTPPEDNAYHNCMWDFCAGCQEDVFEQYQQIEALEHPEPQCVQNKGNCGQEQICNEAVTLSLENGPFQNNLGGAGPDSGAAELRYSKAGSFNGKNLDLVVTAEGYKPKKPSMNGAKGQFGRINLQCGTNAAFQFSWVDSDTGEAVEVPDIAVSFYDMDEGKRGKGRNKITACGASDLFVSADSELSTEQRSADCFSAESSKPGAKNNEPENPLLLTQDQMSRSASFSFKSSKGASFDVSMGKCSGARNLQFTVRPTVACAEKF